MQYPADKPVGPHMTPDGKLRTTGASHLGPLWGHLLFSWLNSSKVLTVSQNVVGN